MKYLIFALVSILYSIGSSAQITKKQGREVVELYTETDPFLKGYKESVPADYAKESAVILDDVEVGKYSTKGPSRIYRIVYYRILLKIQDDAARDLHSTFSYRNNNLRTFGYRDVATYAMRIVKPDGSIRDIDLESLEKNADQEVAIPNLEAGDILDYGLRIEETSVQDCFSPEIGVLTGNYPLIKGYKRFIVNRGFFMNCKSLRGAPEIEMNKEESTSQSIVYELNFAKQKRTSTEKWVAELRSEPAFKMQLCYSALIETRRSPQILGDPYSVKSEASDVEKRRAIRFYHYENKPLIMNNMLVDPFKKWYRNTYGQIQISNEEYMKIAFYYLRYYTIVFDQILNQYNQNYHEQYLMHNYFHALMETLASGRNIDNEIVYTNSRYIGTFNELIMSDEFIPVFRYRGDDGEWKYLETPHAFQTIDYLDPGIRGQEGISNVGALEYVKIPEVSPDKNYRRVEFTVTPNLEDKSVNIESDNKFLGEMKYEVSKYALRYTDYYEDAAKAMLIKGAIDAMDNKRKVQRGKESSAGKLAYDYDAILMTMKESLEHSFKVDKYTSFNLISSGVVSDLDTLHYQEQFSVADAITKVGPNSLLSMGKIVFEQVTFTDEEISERKNDVYWTSPATNEFRCIIKVPEGYKAKGFESLNGAAETPYGSYELKSVLNGSEVIIDLKKIYSTNFVPKEDWAKIMEFVIPAAQFNKANIVFEKITN